MINKLLDNLPIISCQEATRIMSEAMERRLSFKEYINLKMHLFVCDFCVRFQKQIKSLRQLILAYRHKTNDFAIPVGPNLSAQAKTQIKQILKNQK